MKTKSTIDEQIDEKIDEAIALVAEKIKSQLRATLKHGEAQFAPLIRDLDVPSIVKPGRPTRSGEAVAPRGLPSLSASVATDGSIRPLVCIAPGCDTPNKGPRLGYTCDEHKGASKSKKAEWRARFIEQVRSRLDVPRPKAGAKKVPRAASRVESAEKAKKIVDAIRARGKSGASLHDIVKTTRMNLDFIRGKLWRLRKRGTVKVVGKTSRARYFAT